MSTVDLISRLKKSGIRIWVQEDALKYKAPVGTLTDELKAEIVSRKKEIISFLKNEKSSGEISNEITVVPRNENLPLSHGQKWLWLQNRTEEQIGAFNIPAAFVMKGSLNMEALHESLNRIVRRHEILRTNYNDINGEPVQIIKNNISIEMTKIDISRFNEKKREEKVILEFRNEMNAPFNLMKDPPFRVKLIKLSEKKHVLLTGFHHIACDDQSVNIFMNELVSLYTAIVNGENGELPELKIQYADYAKWQNEMLDGGLDRIKLSYWNEKLHGIESIPEIPGDYTRPDIVTFNSIHKNYILDENVAARLKIISQKSGSSLYMTILTIFNLLLYQYSGIKDIVIGSHAAGREKSELKRMIGLFCNTVAIRTKINGNEHFRDLLEKVKESVTGAFLNQEIPFGMLVRNLNLYGRSNGTPLFQALFNMYAIKYREELPGLEIEPLNIDVAGGRNINSKFDITLLAVEYESGIRIDFSFKSDLFSEKTVNWLAKHFKILNSFISENPDICIGELPELKPMKPEQAIIDHQYTVFRKEETGQSIVSRFEKKAAENPEKTAVEMSGKNITYSELKKAASRLSALIKNSADSIPILVKREKIRYSRQILLDQWGLESQERLKSLTVFAAGAGGSGSPVIMQLALLGVGTIIICDFDSIELSNLNRQVLHDESRIGMNKAESAAISVRRINPNVKVIVRKEKIDRDNIFELVGNSAVIFDNVDNLDAKFAISECAVAKRIPHVISSMIERSSYAAIFHTPYTPCFHCCYDRKKLETVPEPDKEESGWNKAVNSVASPALFLSAGFAVNEALKIVLGFENPSYNKYFLFNNQGSTRFSQTRGFKIVTYPFSRHFMETCKKNGFDWEQGFTGKFVEEIAIEKDPDCMLCSSVKEGDPLPESSNMPVITVKNESGCPETVVLLISHSIDMIIGILGVLKSGKAFVTMDPECPKDRLKYILYDANAHLIITDKENENLALEIRNQVNRNIKIFNINEIYSDSRIVEYDKDFSDPDGLAYIIYKFGFTDRPKGVMQKHRNVLHYIMNYTNGLHIDKSDRLSSMPVYGSGTEMTDIFAALTNGATLCMYDIRKYGPHNPGKWLNENKITIYHSVPEVFRHFAMTIESGMEFPGLRIIYFDGEPVSSTDVELYKKHFSGGCILVSGLGTAELNLIRLYIINKDAELTRNLVPAGYSVEDTEIVLNDENGEPVGYNRTGEIVIKSPYLSPGYWEPDDRTAASFKPGFAESGDRLYHTGDPGRFRTDGCLEHLDRSSLQPKAGNAGHRKIKAADTDNYKSETNYTAAFENPAIDKPAGPAGAEKPGYKDSGIETEQNVINGENFSFTYNQIAFLNTIPNLIKPSRFNMSILLEIDFTLNQTLIEQVIRFLLDCHEALRARFRLENGKWKQYIEDIKGNLPFQLFDFSHLEEAEQVKSIEKSCDDLQNSLDLEYGPLIQFAYFKIGNGKPGRFFIVMHHLAGDNISMRILLNDFQTAYQQLAQTGSINLTKEITPFGKFVKTLNSYCRSEQLEGETNYWLKLPWKEVRLLTGQYPNTAKKNTEGSTAKHVTFLSESETRKLLLDAPAFYKVPLTNILMTPYVESICKWLNRDWLYFEATDPGRTIYPFMTDMDLSRTVGFLVISRSFVLKRLDPGSLPEKVGFINRQIEGIPNCGIGYTLLARLGNENNEQVRKLQMNFKDPPFLFNYLGLLDIDVSSMHEAKENTGLFRHPDETRYFQLECISFIRQEKLYLQWNYSTNVFWKKTISEIAGNCHYLLKKIIEEV